MTFLGLEDKVIFVTGGSRGIGAAIINLLQDFRAKVAYVDRIVTNPHPGTLALEADVANLAEMIADLQKFHTKIALSLQTSNRAEEIIVV